MSKTINDLNKSLTQVITPGSIGAATSSDLNTVKNNIGTVSNLSTTNKTIVGAINELFQNVDSGKQLIADAIDDESITKDSTFEAMSEAIVGLKSSGMICIEGNVNQTASGGSQGINSKITINFDQVLATIPSRILVYFEYAAKSPYTSSYHRRVTVDSKYNYNSSNSMYIVNEGSYNSYFIDNITTSSFDLNYILPSYEKVNIISYSAFIG